MRLMTYLILLTTVFAANSQDLKIGMQPYDPPFSIQVNSKHQFTGFEAQLMDEICKRLKANCTYIPLELNAFFPQLLAHNIDLALGQISITLEREKQFIFSMPYMVSRGQFITNKDSSIKTVLDIQGKKVGIFKGSFYKDYLLQTFNDQVNVIEFINTPLAFESLLNNDVDVLLLADIDEGYWIANNALDEDDFRFIGKPIPLGNGYGIISNMESVTLITEINKALADMESDGSYLQIYNLYFGSINQIFTATSLQQ